MPKPKLTDAMIGSPDLKATTAFYKSFLKMKLADKGDGSFVILSDPETDQRVCIMSMPKLKNAALGVDTPDLERSLAALQKLGGKVTHRWSYPKMIGANCKDPDGHELILWQSLKVARKTR